MTSPASVLMIGMLGVALLMGDSAPTLGGEQPKQASLAEPADFGAFPLQPITGLEEAKKQISRGELHIPPTGYERSLRLAHLARVIFFLGGSGRRQGPEK